MASITKYVKEHHFDEVPRAGIGYFLQNVIDLGVSVDELIEWVSVEHSEIEYVSVGNREDNLIDIDVLLNIYAEVSKFSNLNQNLLKRKIVGFMSHVRHLWMMDLKNFKSNLLIHTREAG